MSRRRILVVIVSVLMASATLAATTTSPASAAILLPSFKVTPDPVVLGQIFTVQDGYRTSQSDPASPLGCPNATDWVLDDPNGNAVAIGHIDAETIDPDTGLVIQTFASQAVLSAADLPGIYTIQLDQDSLPCDGGPFGMPPNDIDVVAPAGYTPPTFTLGPTDQTNMVGGSATVTASVSDPTSGAPEQGVIVDFAVTGPNANTGGLCQPTSCATASDGTVTWNYDGTAVGHDTVNASLDGESGPGTRQQVAAEWTHSLSGYRYAALGDSYSSGEGTLVYDPTTNQPDVNMCHRSQFAYGPKLAAIYPTALGDIDHVACSGAVTNDLFEPNHAGNQAPNGTIEPAQLCTANLTVASCGTARIPALGPNTKAVTLTIGGNDVGFTDVLKSCIWTSVNGVRVAQPGHPNCSVRSDVTGPLTRRLAALAGNGSATAPAAGAAPVHSYAAVLSAIHRTAPNAHVYIAGYPRLFQDTNLRTCTVGTAIINTNYGFDLDITALDAAYLDTMATLLNREILTAVQRAGSWASYVDVTSRFTGHGLCSTNPWLNPINGSATISLGVVTVGPIPTQDAHPTITGQAQGYEAAFIAAGVAHQ